MEGSSPSGNNQTEKIGENGMVPEEQREQGGVEIQLMQDQPDRPEGEQPIMDEASLDNRVPNSHENMGQEQDQDGIQNKIRKYNEKTELLHADQEFLKEEIKVRERETLTTFTQLMHKKKELLELVMASFNQKQAQVDIGLAEELNQHKKVIKVQETKIAELRAEISRQGIAGVLTDDKEFKMKAKAEQMEKEIKVGRKFSSTQYVRDYLERPQAYKVSYEESKFEYELRVRIKECLETEKKIYQKKKEQINQLKRKERQREQELLKQKDLWSS